MVGLVTWSFHQFSVGVSGTWDNLFVQGQASVDCRFAWLLLDLWQGRRPLGRSAVEQSHLIRGWEHRTEREKMWNLSLVPYCTQIPKTPFRHYFLTLRFCHLPGVPNWPLIIGMGPLEGISDWHKSYGTIRIQIRWSLKYQQRRSGMKMESSNILRIMGKWRRDTKVTLKDYNWDS